MTKKLTKENIESIIVKAEYQKMGNKTTICLVTLENGFEVVGQSSCIDPQNYDRQKGEMLALEDAINKVWELEAYRFQCDFKVAPLFDKNIKLIDGIITCDNSTCIYRQNQKQKVGFCSKEGYRKIKYDPLGSETCLDLLDEKSDLYIINMAVSTGLVKEEDIKFYKLSNSEILTRVPEDKKKEWAVAFNEIDATVKSMKEYDDKTLNKDYALVEGNSSCDVKNCIYISKQGLCNRKAPRRIISSSNKEDRKCLDYISSSVGSLEVFLINKAKYKGVVPLMDDPTNEDILDCIPKRVRKIWIDEFHKLNGNIDKCIICGKEDCEHLKNEKQGD